MISRFGRKLAGYAARTHAPAERFHVERVRSTRNRSVGLCRFGRTEVVNARSAVRSVMLARRTQRWARRFHGSTERLHRLRMDSTRRRRRGPERRVELDRNRVRNAYAVQSMREKALQNNRIRNSMICVSNGRVAAGSYPPAAPADPDLPN